MSLKDLIAADVSAVFLNEDEFASELTLTSPTGGTQTMTVNQRLFLLGSPPLPDGVLSVYDRLHYLGVYRIGEGAAGGPTTSTILGIVFLDFEDEGQGNVIETAEGRFITRMGRLEVAADVELVTADKAEACDTITYEGEVWQVLRREGGDEEMATYVIRRDEKITTKRGRKRPQ